MFHVKYFFTYKIGWAYYMQKIYKTAIENYMLYAYRLNNILYFTKRVVF